MFVMEIAYNAARCCSLLLLSTAARGPLKTHPCAQDAIAKSGGRYSNCIMARSSKSSAPSTTRLKVLPPIKALKGKSKARCP